MKQPAWLRREQQPNQLLPFTGDVNTGDNELDVHPWPELETVLSGLNLLVAHLDRDFNILRVNENYAAADGRPADFFPGKNHFELYPDAENEAIFRSVVQNGSAYRASARPFQYPQHPERGVTYWDWVLQPLLDPGGQVDGLLLTLMDVNRPVRDRQELQETQSQYWALLQAAPVVIWAADREGRILLSEGKGLERIGLKPGQIVGQSLYDHAAERGQLDGILTRALAGETITAVLPYPDGQSYFSTSYAPWRGPSGEIVGVVGVSTDVTNQIRAERQIAYQAELLDKVSEAIVAADERGNVTAWNKAAEALFGWSSAEAIGRPSSELVWPGPDDSGEADLIRQLLETGHWSGRAVRYAKDGRRLELEGSIVQLMDENGRVTGIVTVAHDISDRLRQEKQLSYQAFLLNNIADAVIATDPDFIITTCNPSAEHLYDWKAEEVIGKSLPEALDQRLVHGSDEEVLRELKETGLVSGRAVRRAKDGRLTYVSFKTVALKDGAGRVTGYVSVNRDITSIIAAEEQIAYQLLLLEHIGEAVISTDNDLNVTYWNRAAEAIYGWTADEMQGRYLPDVLKSELVVKSRTQAFGEVDEMGLSEGRAVQSTKDGRRITVGHHTVPLFNSAGQRIGIVSVNRDITAQAATEEQVAYQAYLLANVGEAIFSTDADLRITYWNKTAERLYGWTSAELLGKSARDFLQYTTMGRDLDQIFEDLNHTGRASGRAMHLTKDGRRITIEYQALSLRDKDGNFSGVLTNSRDITEQARAEDERRDAEARFRSIYEFSRSAIALLDTQAIFLSCNPAMEKLLGYSQAELAGRSLYELAAPQDAEMEGGLFQELASGKRESYQLEKRMLRKDGSQVWVNVVRSTVKNPDGSVRFVVGMNEDISRRKLLEAELRQVRRRQFESMEADRLRLARELHDGPIQVLFGIDYQLSGMLESFGASQASDLTFVRSQILELINTLRSLSVDLRPPDTQLYGLEQAILTHIDYFQQSFPEIEIRLSLAADVRQLSPSVQLVYYRVFQQSLANAARHGDATRVDVRIAIDMDQSILEIQDNGKGFEMPEDLMLFARSGHLGLIGASERAEAIGGRLEIEAAPGQGTLIRVIAPRTA